MDEKNQKTISFEDVRQKIVEALEERGEKIAINESVTLVDGFLNEPFSKVLTNSIVIGGPTIPMIMLVGNETGKIYFFALRALIGDVWN